jgi:hypothetical protein
MLPVAKRANLGSVWCQHGQPFHERGKVVPMDSHSKGGGDLPIAMIEGAKPPFDLSGGRRSPWCEDMAPDDRV